MTAAPAPPRATGWRLWWMAARPRTLSLSLAPVLAGTALAAAQGLSLRPLPALLALAGAVLIQIGTNLHNDLADAVKGADRPGRTGPPRATALGWVTADRMRRATWMCFGAAAVVGCVLVGLGGWPILVLGATSLLAGWGYSAGPRPISYSPLGEVFVIAFFGVSAVTGTLWLQSPFPAPATLIPALLLGAAVGMPAAAVLTVNNFRDAAPDRAAGRRTLAILLGPAGSRRIYAALMLLPFPLLLLLPAGALSGLAALPVSLRCIRTLKHLEPGPACNELLAATARCQLLLATAAGLGLALV